MFSSFQLFRALILMLTPAAILFSAQPTDASEKAVVPPATTPPASSVFVSSTEAPFVIPDDINGRRMIIAPPPEVKRPLSIAIYDGPGSGKSGIDNVTQRASQLAGTKVTRITAADMGTVDLSKFDLIAFTGGSGSAQAKAIGEAGRANVKKFVANGGGYLGICAGAYLATAGYDWSIGLLNAHTVSPKWRRGQGFVDVEIAKDGRAIIGQAEKTFKCRYANGPIIAPMDRPDLPAFTTAAFFRSELAENGTPVGVMINSPAAAYAPFGKGRVFIISSHTENTPGLENFVPRVLLWLGHEDDALHPASDVTASVP